MLAALLLLGLLPLVALPMMGEDAGDDELDEAADAEADTEPSPLDEILGDETEDGTIHRLVAQPGLTEIDDFTPGEDILEYDLRSVDGELHFDVQDGGGSASFAVTAGPETVSAVQFNGLDTVPAGDIYLKLAEEPGGDSFEISLAEAMQESADSAGPALDPVPGDAPDPPGPDALGEPVDPEPGDAADPPGPEIPGPALDPEPGEPPDPPGPVVGAPLDPLPGNQSDDPGPVETGPVLEPEPEDDPDPPGPEETGPALDPIPGDQPDPPGPVTAEPLDPVPGDQPDPPGPDGGVLEPLPPDTALQVEGFKVGEDFLRLTLEPQPGTGEIADVTVTPSPDGEDGLVSVNGELVAVLLGAPGASVSDVFAEFRPAI